MTVDLVIGNGRVVTPGGVMGGGVAIDGERIVAVGADATLPPARRTIDAREQYVIPGLIDCLCETSVYGGYRFRGMARTTVVRGQVMMDEFETVGAPGWGRYVPRGDATGGRS